MVFLDTDCICVYTINNMHSTVFSNGIDLGKKKDTKENNKGYENFKKSKYA